MQSNALDCLRYALKQSLLASYLSSAWSTWRPQLHLLLRSIDIRIFHLEKTCDVSRFQSWIVELPHREKRLYVKGFLQRLPIPFLPPPALTMLLASQTCFDSQL